MSAESRELTRPRVLLYEGPTYVDCLELLLLQLKTMAREGHVVTMLSVGLHEEENGVSMVVTIEED